jgi:Fe-Mn family superoxide dismutase
MNRRQALGRLAAAGAGLVAANATGAAPSYPAQALSVPAFRGQHRPKPLPFDPAKLKGLSEKLIRSHWENNYQGAVRALNSVEQRLDGMLKDEDLPPFAYGDLKREELIRTGSLVLHEHYFGNLGGDGRPGGDVTNAISRGFGSLGQSEEVFKRTANGLSGGSGWVVLAFNLHTGEAAQLLGVRPHAQCADRIAAPRARHVRARLSDGLRRCGREIHRRGDAEHQLGGGDRRYARAIAAAAALRG